MIFPEKEIQLKDGRIALLRSPLPSDAEAALEYMKITAAETPFLLRTPEEITLTIPDEEKYLSRVAADPYTVSIFCFIMMSLPETAISPEEPSRKINIGHPLASL